MPQRHLKHSPKLFAIIIIASLLSIAAPPNLARMPVVRAQSTSGTLEGEVLDQAGKPLAGVRIIVYGESSGSTSATVTDQNGFYRMPFRSPGAYRVTASVQGYAEAQQRIIVQINTTTYTLPPFRLTPTTVSSTAVIGPPTTSASQEADLTLLVNISDPKRGGNFTERQVESLPIGGAADMRTFDEYALLLPGVAPPPYTPGVRGPGIGFGIGTAGQFSVNGLRARSNNFTVDGSDNNDPDVGVRRQGFVALVPQSIESIRGYQVTTLLWDRELGRNMASQVNAVSKEGGPRFHGHVYGFITDSKLNARNFFDYTSGASGGENPFTRVQYGFAAGGPIVKDKLHFFASLERINISSSTEQHFATPREDERRFSNLNEFGVLLPPRFFPLDFFRTMRGQTPAGRNVLSLYPLPNNPGGPYGANTYTEILPADGDGVVASLKLTHQFNELNVLNARYNFTDDNRVLPSINRAIRSTVESDTRTQNLSVIFDTQLNATLYNQARFSYGRTRLDLFEYTGNPSVFSSAIPAPVDVAGSPTTLGSSTGPIGELLIEPFSPVGVNAYIFPQSRVNNTFQFADSVAWSVSSHSLKFGADVRRVHLDSELARNYRPQVVFGNAIIAPGQLNFLAGGRFEFAPDANRFLLSGAQLATIGLPSSIFQTITADVPDPAIELRLTEWNFFFNDNWRVKENLTFDFGLRYEYNTVPREASGRIESALRLEGLPSAGNSAADTTERTRAFNEAVEAYRQALGGRARIYDPDRNNFAPHFGFAWAPGGEGRISVRGGYGIYYDAILGAVVSQSRNVFPNEIPVNVEPGFIDFDVFNLNNPSFLIVNNAGNRMIPPIRLIREGTLNQFGGSQADFAALIGQLFLQNRRGGGLAFTLPAKDLRTPYAQQWHMTVERRLLDDYAVSAAYVGTKGTKLTRLTTPNLGPNVTPFIALANRFDPTPPGGAPPPTILADCSLLPNGRCSIQPNRPQPALGAYQVFENSSNSIYHALQLEARKRYAGGYSFTMAYTWSHAIDDASDVFAIAGAPVLPQNSFNQRLERASANFDVRHRFALSLIWDLPFYRGATGALGRALGGWQVASIVQASTGQPFTLNVPFDANFDGNLTDRPSTIEGLIFLDGHSRRRVAVPAELGVTRFFIVGQDGAVGRNTARADSQINWDLALNKTFRFSESHSLQFRSEFFNVLNRANFGIPIRTLGNPGFGSAVETATPARVIQFALKYRF